VRRALREHGSDLSKPTDIRWFVYFPTQATARAFAGKAHEAGYRTEVRRSRRQWLCIASRDAVPSLKRIRAMETELGARARAVGGEVDGWEAAVQEDRP
jgi:hypothetical protein